MTDELDETKTAETLEEIEQARNILKEYLEFKRCPNFQLGIVGVRGDYGIIVYISDKIDTTFIIPVEIDGVPVRVCRREDMSKFSKQELKALGAWYSKHCSVTGNPLMEGPCHQCNEPGYWEVDPFLEDVHGTEEWNFWCAECYSLRAEEI